MFDAIEESDIYLAFELATEAISDIVSTVFFDRKNIKLRNSDETISLYHPCLYSHYAFLGSSLDYFFVAEYFAHLQSFSCDFLIDVPGIAFKALNDYKDSNAIERAYLICFRVYAAELAEFLFLQHAEFNPYSAFMKGSISAETVISKTVVNLQIALVRSILEEFGEYNIVVSQYKEAILAQLQ